MNLSSGDLALVLIILTIAGCTVGEKWADAYRDAEAAKAGATASASLKP